MIRPLTLATSSAGASHEDRSSRSSQRWPTPLCWAPDSQGELVRCVFAQRVSQRDADVCAVGRGGRQADTQPFGTEAAVELRGWPPETIRSPPLPTPSTVPMPTPSRCVRPAVSFLGGVSSAGAWARVHHCVGAACVDHVGLRQAVPPAEVTADTAPLTGAMGGGFEPYFESSSRASANPFVSGAATTETHTPLSAKQPGGVPATAKVGTHYTARPWPGSDLISSRTATVFPSSSLPGVTSFPRPGGGAGEEGARPGAAAGGAAAPRGPGGLYRIGK